MTRKMRELLDFIVNSTATSGIPPSFDEMKDAVGLKSKSNIHRLLQALEERGYIKRIPNRARAIEVRGLAAVTQAAPSSR